MEHPDPCGFQLARLALAVDGLLYAQDWIEDENAGFFVFFIDYISLYQQLPSESRPSEQSERGLDISPNSLL